VLGARLLGVSVDYATHPWVFVGWAIMSGLFSTQALRKLRELFDVMFQAKRQETSSTQLAARAPLVEAVAPITVTKPAPDKKTPPLG